MPITADQVVVELRALTDQHDAALKKAANTATAAFAAIEDSAGKEADAVAKASARLEAAVLRTEQAHAKAASSAKAAADATTQATQRRAAADQSGTAADLKAAAAAEAAAARKTAAAQRAAAAAKVAAADQVAAANRAAAAVEVAANRSVAAMGRQAAASDGGVMRRGGGLQNAALQFQDIIVQAQAGAAAATIFAQQGSQILGAFGPWGAVLGVAAAAVGILASSLGDFTSAADKAKAAQKAFEEAMKASKGVFSDQEQAAIDLVNSLSLVERGLLNIAQQQIEGALRTNETALQAFADQAKRAAANIRGIIEQDIFDRGGTFLINPATVGELNAALNELTSTATPTAAQINRVLAVVQQMAPAMRESGLGTDQYVDAMARAGGEASTLEGKQAALERALDKVNARQGEVTNSAIAAGNAATKMGNDAVAVRLQILDLVAALAAFNSEATGARSAAALAGVTFDRELQQIRAQTEAYKKGKDAVDALSDAKQADRVRSEAADAARQQGLSTNEQRAAGDEAAAAKLEELKQKRLYDIREAARRKAEAASRRGGGAAARQQVRTDSALAQIEQQIDLNERLIAVHSQGPEALAREKAAYDALNSARQLGYKVGTAEHAQYVQRYQDLAEQRRQQDVILADFGKADALTKSVMTSQERYNVTLAEYNRLRENGTLQEEAYLRLVRDLKAENSGYADGIQAISQAIQGGIQSATSFSDALIKIGLSLAQLIAQAALFGQGPLAKLFDALAGTSGGIFGLTGAIGGALGGGGGLVQPSGSPISVPIPVKPPGLASGGQALPGKLYEVGETGREWFAPSVPGQVIPNSAIKAAAGGGGGGGQPIQFNISLAGANGDRTIAEIAAAAVKRGLTSVPEINRQHRIRFSPT